MLRARRTVELDLLRGIEEVQPTARCFVVPSLGAVGNERRSKREVRASVLCFASFKFDSSNQVDVDVDPRRHYYCLRYGIALPSRVSSALMSDPA